MEFKTKKSEIQAVVGRLQNITYSEESEFRNMVEQEILSFKIKFPLLEHFAVEVMELIPVGEHSKFLQWIVDKDYIGSYVIAGKFLQIKLSDNMLASFEDTVRYFIQGDKWYCCDIMSERVFGEALLLDFERAFLLLTDFTKHDNPWVRRGIGVSIHYAVKRKISPKKAQRLLDLTLSQLHDKHIEAKKGFGWGLKTLTKFHPMMVVKVKDKIEAPGVSRYYRTKMNTGFRLAGVKIHNV